MTRRKRLRYGRANEAKVCALLGVLFSILLTSLALARGAGEWTSVVSAVEPDVIGEVGQSYGGDLIVYTARQGWLSRIYLLAADGSVVDYFEYEFYYMADLEVVQGEVYVSEAYAPRVYKVQLDTGGLEVVVDDWSLYYFYDLAFDGEYFYLNEWDLNRYDLTGEKDGTASFDESVHGGAWDGSYYWTLTDEGEIKCWDLSTWPSLSEITENAFSPPTTACRGLWFDGQYFWTAEGSDGFLGNIYRFDYDGVVVDQWLEPAFSGWGVCFLDRNSAPTIPVTPVGAYEWEAGEECTLRTVTTDLEGDQVYYLWDWGDESPETWRGPDEEGDTATGLHVWTEPDTYVVRVKAKDVYDEESAWSEGRVIVVFTKDFVRGDASGDMSVEMSDAIFTLRYLYVPESAEPTCVDAADSDDSGDVQMADALYTLKYLYVPGTPAPPAPFPSCGGDPTTDLLGCELHPCDGKTWQDSFVPITEP
jgi:hypothetical protein